MIAKFTAWYLDLCIRILKAIGGVLYDFVITVLDAVVGVLGAAVSSIPVPSFLSTYSIGNIINMMPDYVLYYVSHFRIGESMAIIGAGFAFRMTRKILTLGQW
ncbi:hypothetical protein [Collimonas fungivorans]|uniref:hypothetical protein n=1 Tax=Collimonas fungivorans TaxID=158899 RepID=UPI003FA3D357